MGLYPDLDQGAQLKPKSAFKSMDQLAFSSASRAVPNFETVNDKVLREMNERAKKQLQNRVEPATNPFKLGDTTSKLRSPQRQRLSSVSSGSKRFSLLHRTQFSRMESIESHPKVVAKNSRRDLRQEFTKGTDPKGPSPAKRGQAKPEESPTKRVRHTDKTIQKSASRHNLRLKSSSIDLKPDLKPEATFMKRSETSERVRARASMRSLRAPVLAAPNGPPKVEMSERDPTKRVSVAPTPAPAPAPTPTPTPATERTLRRSARVAQSQLGASAGNLGTQRAERASERAVDRTPKTKLSGRRASIDQSSFGSDMSMDTSTMSELTFESPGATAPVPHVRSVRDRLAECPNVPKHLPSYARPTASAMRRSQSQHTIGKTDPSRIASMFRGLARVPRRDPRA